ncbi:hypothetical protein JHK87_045144 [Glycine soja]|nr:hypothetical protein JHK87_045144 [Glycine soja]
MADAPKKFSWSNVETCIVHRGPNQPSNFTHGKEYLQDKQLESDITFHVGKQEAELALTVNNAAFNRDLYQLKGLICARADPNKTDYDGRSPLYLEASRGYEDITLFLMQECLHNYPCKLHKRHPCSLFNALNIIAGWNDTRLSSGGLYGNFKGEKLKYGDRC